MKRFFLLIAHILSCTNAKAQSLVADTTCISFQYGDSKGHDALVANCIPCGYDTSNYGTHYEFDAIAWTNGGNISNCRSLIYWDLANIPPSAIVDSAIISLFWDSTSSNVGHSQLSGLNDAWFLKVSQPWDENTVTWNTQPTVDTAHRAYVHPSNFTNENYVVNVTALMQDIVSNPINNYGLMLQLDTESYYRSLVFCSSDYPDDTKHPRLDICFSMPTNISSSENEIFFSAIVSPNPFHNSATLTINDQSQTECRELKIFDVFGGCVCTQKMDSQKTIINREGLYSGIYFYSVTNAEGQMTKGKIIIK